MFIIFSYRMCEEILCLLYAYYGDAGVKGGGLRQVIVFNGYNWYVGYPVEI